MIVPVILAAGRSTRMRQPKALLPDREGRPFVARIVRTLITAGLDNIVVVTGETHEAVKQALEVDGAEVLFECCQNPHPARGQLSSLWVGLDVAEARGAEAVLVTLVDVPMVAPKTVRQVIDAWLTSSALIARPAIGEKHGHPVIFDCQLFGALRQAPLDEGAKAVITAHPRHILNVETTDEGCLTNVNVQADYDAIVS